MPAHSQRNDLIGWMVCLHGFVGFEIALKSHDMTPSARPAAQARGRGGFEVLGADRAAHREARAAVWEARLQTAARSLGVALARLPAKKSAVEKVQLAALLKQATSVSNGWLAERLAMGAPGSVTQFVRRWRAGGGAATRRFKAALSKVHT